jgi:hypothetical protein
LVLPIGHFCELDSPWLESRRGGPLSWCRELKFFLDFDLFFFYTFSLKKHLLISISISSSAAAHFQFDLVWAGQELTVESRDILD